MKLPQNYLDSNGLVIQSNGDGGDSLNRTCVTALLMESLGKEFFMAERLRQLECEGSPGKYRRNNHLNKWYSNCDRTSRDQMIPLVMLLGIRNTFRYRLVEMFMDHLGRGLLFAYNTRKNFQYPTEELHKQYSTPDVAWDYRWKIPDLTGPEFWALYIRAFKFWPLYPLLYLFDLETLMSSAILRFQKNKDDVINHALVLEYGRQRFDTFWMKLSRKLNPRSFLQEKLDRFFGREEEPPINVLYGRLRD